MRSKALVEDVMTQPFHFVSVGTPFKSIVQVIEHNRISGVPVLDAAGQLVGIVSEADLLLKEERRQLEAGRRLWEPRRHRLERRKAAGLTAADLMTAPVVVVDREARVSEAVRIMLELRVKRLPVVDQDGRVVGIVSRGDLLKVFLRADAEIRTDVMKIATHTLRLDSFGLEVIVKDGVVRLEGRLPRRTDVEILGSLTAKLDGVIAIDSQLGYELDDTKSALAVGPIAAGGTSR